MKRIEVKWIDSCGGSHYWADVDSFNNKPDRITTVGYLVKSSKRAVTVAASKASSQVGGVITIPRSSIKSIKKMK
jgi:hypothetical protein